MNTIAEAEQFAALEAADAHEYVRELTWAPASAMVHDWRLRVLAYHADRIIHARQFIEQERASCR